MFRISEIINFAVEIEKNGERFYSTVASLLEEGKAKEIFKGLAAEEGKHIGDFEILLSTVSAYQSPESYEGEYAEYLKALVDQHVFNQNADIDALAKNITDGKSAIDLALNFEKDSILFFNEMGKLVAKDEKKGIDALIAEEHKHILTLVELKKSL